MVKKFKTNQIFLFFIYFVNIFIISTILVSNAQTTPPTTYNFCFYDENNLLKECKNATDINSTGYGNWDCFKTGNSLNCFSSLVNQVCGIDGRNINDIITKRITSCNFPSKCDRDPTKIEDDFYLENTSSTDSQDHYRLYCKRNPTFGVGEIHKCDKNGQSCTNLKDFFGEERTGEPDCNPITLFSASEIVNTAPSATQNFLLLHPTAKTKLSEARAEIEQAVEPNSPKIFDTLINVTRAIDYNDPNNPTKSRSMHKAGRAIEFNPSNIRVFLDNGQARGSNYLGVIARPDSQELSKYSLFLKRANSNEEVNITQILEKYNWTRIPKNQSSEEIGYYEFRPDGISWENAMKQAHPQDLLEITFNDIDWKNLQCSTSSVSQATTRVCSLTGSYYTDYLRDPQIGYGCNNPDVCEESNIFSEEASNREPQKIFCVQTGNDPKIGEKFLCPNTTKGLPANGFKLLQLNSYDNLFASAKNPNGDMPAKFPFNANEIPAKYRDTNLVYCRLLSAFVLTTGFTVPISFQSVPINPLLTVLAQLLFALSVFLFILFMIISGIRLVRAASDPAKLATVKKGIFSTIAGFLFIIFASGFIINIINIL